jgi:hypothetical protein
MGTVPVLTCTTDSSMSCLISDQSRRFTPCCRALTELASIVSEEIQRTRTAVV